jgi:hypothetical protein
MRSNRRRDDMQGELVCSVCGKRIDVEFLPARGIKVKCACVEYRLHGGAFGASVLHSWRHLRDSVHEGGLVYVG